MQPTLKKDKRSEKQKRQDIIIALLCCFVIKGVDTVRLYSVNKIFGGFIKRFEEKSHEDLNFYRDIVTRVYKELVGIFEDVMYRRFIRPIPGFEDVHFDICITPNIALGLLRNIPEADLVKEIFPDFLNAYETGAWNNDQDEEDLD